MRRYFLKIRIPSPGDPRLSCFPSIQLQHSQPRLQSPLVVTLGLKCMELLLRCKSHQWNSNLQSGCKLPHFGIFCGFNISGSHSTKKVVFYKHVCHYQQLIIPSMLGSRNCLQPFNVLTESNLPGLSCVFGRCANSRGTSGTDLKQLSNIYIINYNYI